MNVEEKHPFRILVIDDNPDDRELVLCELGVLFPLADVVTPCDPIEFDNALTSQAPSLVVTDLDIHWTNGGEVLSAVKSRYPTCPVIMFTGTGDEVIAVELMKAGLDDYVVKSSRQRPRLRASLKLAVEMAQSRSALSNREAQLEAMVAHRDTIVRELHHRVKNNLQTMISLLQVRGREVDAATRGHFDEVARRMAALGAVQSRIYEVGALDQVDFGAALSDIAGTLASTYGHAALELDFDGPLHLDVDRAMPFALLCYEVILNALKHAWPYGPRGKLVVQIRAQIAATAVRIQDDGVGFVGTSIRKGLGTRLTYTLAQEARVEVESLSNPGHGTLVTLRLL